MEERTQPSPNCLLLAFASSSLLEWIPAHVFILFSLQKVLACMAACWSSLFRKNFPKLRKANWHKELQSSAPCHQQVLRSKFSVWTDCVIATVSLKCFLSSQKPPVWPLLFSFFPISTITASQHRFLVMSPVELVTRKPSTAKEAVLAFFVVQGEEQRWLDWETHRTTERFELAWTTNDHLAPLPLSSWLCYWPCSWKYYLLFESNKSGLGDLSIYSNHRISVNSL